MSGLKCLSNIGQQQRQCWFSWYLVILLFAPNHVGREVALLFSVEACVGNTCEAVYRDAS